jgi:signal transduction histidine kinase
VRKFIQKESLDRVSVDVNEVVRDAVNLMSAETKKRGVVVEQELMEGAVCVTGTFIQLEQVVLNLIGNGLDAIDRRPKGDGRIRVGTSANGSGEVELTVWDNGKGVSPRIAGKMFDAFVSTKTGGLGMGLSISRSIVESHGGRIRVDPDCREGTLFRVALPAADES